MLLLEIGECIVAPHRRCDAIAAIQKSLRHDPTETGGCPSEDVPQDMIAVRFGGDVRFVTVASPAY